MKKKENLHWWKGSIFWKGSCAAVNWAIKDWVSYPDFSTILLNASQRIGLISIYFMLIIWHLKLHLKFWTCQVQQRSSQTWEQSSGWSVSSVWGRGATSTLSNGSWLGCRWSCWSLDPSLDKVQNKRPHALRIRSDQRPLFSCDGFGYRVLGLWCSSRLFKHNWGLLQIPFSFLSPDRFTYDVSQEQRDDWNRIALDDVVDVCLLGMLCAQCTSNNFKYIHFSK